jgi:glucokinase
LAQRRLAQPHAPSALDAMPIDQITGKHVGEAALAGDALAVELVTTLGTYLGKGLAILIDVLNPECIVLGSMAVRLGDLLLTPVWDVIRKEALELGWSNCRIVPAQLSGHIGDVAALCAAIYNAEHVTK